MLERSHFAKTLEAQELHKEFLRVYLVRFTKNLGL